jgi:membrane-bound serine protease (ClpP class)
MNRKISLIILFSFLLICVPVFGALFSAETAKEKKSPEVPPPAGKQVHLITVDAVIAPGITEFINRSIEKAAEAGAEAIVIQLDTPGGLVDSMREIVKEMMTADIPVIVYVGPSGARAASAGVFITMAADIAAMAPGTRIGAAHPVTMQGKMDETMEAKVVNDLAAMARGIAEKRGKNAQWAEEAVRKSVSVTETEALKLNVIDLVSPDVASILAAIDGKTVELAVGKRTLQTKNAEVKTVEMGFRYKFLNVISNPNIAYILMILGFYGIYFELSNPGGIFPGVAGAICLILAFYALQTLPINYAGLLLIILGVGLFIAEAFVASGGVLGVGGAIAMIIGSLMLIESPAPYLRISWAVIIPVVASSAVLFIITIKLALRVHREKADTGMEGMLGLEGEALSDIHAGGQISVHGEIWNASSDELIKKGQRVTVTEVEGLKLKVRKAG